MSPTHIHLLVNHLPIIGSILGCIVLIYGLWKKSNDTKIAGYLVLIIASLGGYVSFFSGKLAEDTVELIPAVAKNMIHLHEDSTTLSLTALIFLGVSSFYSLIVTSKNIKKAKTLGFITLSIALVCFGMTSWTGYLGGQIRHTEINSIPVISQYDVNH